MRLLYSLLHYLLMPYVVGRLVWRGIANRGYWQRWGERFGYGEPLPPWPLTLWVHAVSVGEVHAAMPLVRVLRERYPQARIVVTTTTPTGSERVTQLLGEGVVHRFMVYDLPGAVRRFLDGVAPDIAVIMETELWPNLLHACRRRGIPVVLANARLSERSARGYGRLPRFAAAMLRDLTAVAAQSAADAERLVRLGAEPGRVEVTGSVKFDVRLPASLREQGQALRRCWGVDRGVWIAASTHEGEDEQVLDAFARVSMRVPDCLLVLVPRHPERFARVATLCRRRGYRTTLRSESPDSCNATDIYVGDTMGELPVFYSASDVAFVGGSLVEVGGHNMMEPAALGLPVLIGPHVFNFAEISRRLCEVGAARQVADAGALGAAVVEFLSDANLRHSTGEKGLRFVEKNRGALDRIAGLVERFVPAPTAAVPAAAASDGYGA